MEKQTNYISIATIKNFQLTNICITCDQVEDVLLTIQDVTILIQQNSCQVLSIKNENQENQETEDAEAEEV